MNKMSNYTKNSNLGNFLDMSSVPPSSPRKTPFTWDLFERPHDRGVGGCRGESPP